MAGPTGKNTGSTSNPLRRAVAARVSPAAGTAPASQPGAVAGEPGPAVDVKAPAVAPAPTAPREGQALLFAMLVVTGGFVAIVLALWLVLVNKTSADPTAILGVITTPIAGLGGAFFGVIIGQQGTAAANRERAAAEAAKDEAQMRTIKFAAHMDPAVARRLVD